MKKTLSSIAVLLACLIVSTLVLTACGREYQLKLDENLQANIIDDNYRTFYEIFVGGFSDSNGDGMGDLRGVINRLDYLNDGNPNSGKSLGITGIWLMPIMPSRSYHKYDVINYKAIDSSYGTMDDMRELVTEAHKRGINVIIDLVLNHTSTYNPWFTKAREARRKGDTSDPYYDYYTVKIGQSDNKSWWNFATDPDGNNWVYEGNFSSEMPELNYDNPAVKAGIEDIVRFWLGNVGVDGFRLDAVRYIYYEQTAQNVEFLTWFRNVCQEVKEDVYIVGEDWADTAEELNYYQAIDVFNFNIGKIITSAIRAPYAESFGNQLQYYYAAAKEAREDAILQPFLSNHDQDRVAGSFYDGETFDSAGAKMAASMYLLSSGSPFIYYGEEIGMLGSRGSANTDANRRLAMLWGDSDKVKDPVGTTFNKKRQVNGTVRSQVGNSESLFNHYKKVIAIRNAYPEIARGDVEVLTGIGDELTVCILKFTYQGSTVYIVHNIDIYDVTLNLAALNVGTLRAVVGDGQGQLSEGKLTLNGLTTAVLK